MREEALNLETISGRRVPGVQTGPGRTIRPLYTTAAT